MKKWFTSDLHFGHANVIRYSSRPFNSVAEMDNHMINMWNKHIDKQDMVYIIGDFSFHDKETTKKIVARLNGRKILILGNHDKYRKHTIQDWIDMGFHDVKDEELIKLSNKQLVLLKHYPYPDPWYKKAWAKLTGKEWYNKPYHYLYPQNKGLWHIHGHIHNGLKKTNKQINVNVDTWKFKPVSEGEIVKMMDDGLMRRIKFYLMKTFKYGKN